MAKSNQEKKIKESSGSHTIRFVIIIVLLALIVLAFYLRLTNQSKNSNQQAEENMTEVEILKHYDFANQYPKTVRDVVKLHCRLLKCIYNEDLEAEDIQTLNEQTRHLFAEDLLNENVESEQLTDLMNDVEEFHSADKIFVSYTVDVEDNIQYHTMEGKDYATIYVTCNIKEGTVTNAIQEQYLLVKEKEQWKILGWQGIGVEGSDSETSASNQQ